MRVAINGFGRIGRLVLRQAISHPDIQVVAVNDLVTADNLAYLLKHDTIHGRYKGEVEARGNAIFVNGQEILVYNEKDPSKLPWKDLSVDYIVEASGKFTKAEDAEKHLVAGAKRVIITAPSKSEKVPTFVYGVNHTNYNPRSDKILSNASCTTNCLAPITKVLLENFGIEEALMTTVHAVTAAQQLVDGSSKKDWRGGRSAFLNIIPASTGAANAVALCLPEVKGKLTGMAFRVPVADVSVVDLTVRLSRQTSYEEICKKMKEASEGSLKGIVLYCEEEVVSSDFIGSPYSAIFDAKAGIALNGTFYKLIAWYDNEMAFASRIVDLMEYMAKQEK